MGRLLRHVALAVLLFAVASTAKDAKYSVTG